MVFILFNHQVPTVHATYFLFTFSILKNKETPSSDFLDWVSLSNQIHVIHTFGLNLSCEQAPFSSPQ
jgi:hypothetical protein